MLLAFIPTTDETHSFLHWNNCTAIPNIGDVANILHNESDDGAWSTPIDNLSSHGYIEIMLLC